jgi:SanA protein
MDMKKSLMKEGIPEEVIFLDYAGFRTLDSVVRVINCNKIYKQFYIKSHNLFVF